MTSRTIVVPRTRKSESLRGEGPNWVLIAGGALLSTLSIHLGYKLKQALTKHQDATSSGLKGKGKSLDRRKSDGRPLHSNVYSFRQEDEGCFHCMSGAEGMMEMNCPPNGQILTEPDGSLPLVTVPTTEFKNDIGVIWASSPDRLELPPKPFHQSNCSDSPCVSESGSDIFSKREVIHKLRQQLKRRDEMTIEMQDQIVELQNILNSQVAHSTQLQSQLDAANRVLFRSDKEIQRLRKAIADHCVGHVDPMNKSPSTVTIWPTEATNGHANGYHDGNNNFEVLEQGRGNGERIETLKREVGELKEVIEGKEYLLQSYKEQTAELSVKVRDLQLRLDSQLPNIL